MTPAAVAGSLRSPVSVDEFDGYRLLRELGAGAMGQVFLAEDTVLQRSVAVKFIASVEPGAEERERFLLEARAIARLQHPNVVAIYRVGEVEGLPYLVSEYLQGQGLDTLGAAIPWHRALRIGVGLARGLAAAHKHGVLHRDIKPANAMLCEDGEAKLLDFGLAKLVGGGPGPQLPRPTRTPDLTTTQDFPLLRPVLESAEVEATVLSPARAGRPASTVAGTPLYMAPEIWCGEPASFRSDVYSLGALLYHLCAGRPPHQGATLAELQADVLGREPAPLAERAVEPRLAHVVERCLRRDPAQRFSSGDELRAALERLLVAPASLPDGNPYRGLSPFDAEHRALFFGREAALRGVLERLKSQRLLLLAGDSGVGKTSLCRAAVLPAIAEGALDPSRAWSVATVAPGRRPLAALVAALAPHLGGGGASAEEQLARRLADEPAAVLDELRVALGRGRGLVVFVDQLEELLAAEGPEVAPTARFLAAVARAPGGLKILGAVRADFLTRIAALPGLGDELVRALFLLGPLSAEGVREAIVAPARALGVTFDSDTLVTALAGQAAPGDGGLPLLQLALAELWAERDLDAQIIRDGALAAVGGVEGALARHADAAVLALRPAARDAARRVLLALVGPDGSRLRRTEEELGASDPAARAALEALVAARLLLAREGMAGSAFELAHQAFVRGWPTLRRWLEESVDGRVLRARLETAAAEWERLGDAGELLWSARQLAEAAALEATPLGRREQRFLTASRAAARRALARRAAIAAAVPLAVAVAIGGAWLQQKRQRDEAVAERAGQATQLLERARARRTEHGRLSAEALARFDARDSAAAEKLWSRARAAAAEARALYAQAGQTQEIALSLDPARAELRAGVAGALYERALFAEREGHRAAFDELVQRLAVYDEGGRLQRKLQLPTRLSIETEPGAAVELEEGAPGAPRLRSLGPAPLAPLSLAPGSYVVQVTAPGRALARAPVLLTRGEERTLRVPLARAEAVPAGFVYVPAGELLFGSDAEDGLRRGFFNTVPLHRAQTGAFLIAREETTYADWLAYLRALPAGERARRLPKVGKVGFTGALELREDGGVFSLRLQPARSASSAREGEPLVYAGRDRRASQDWLRLPVSGVAFEDAEAYTAWLARSGRVPGARLCDEREWERAARGADGREFPHGDELAADDANFDETYGKDPRAFGPDEVGAHPASRSPFGVNDLAGNVWEWARATVGSEERVVRGGSFYHDQNSSRASNRQVPEPTLRDLTVGIRVCADVGGSALALIAR